VAFLVANSTRSSKDLWIRAFCLGVTKALLVT
jgi:hypothetical protein